MSSRSEASRPAALWITYVEHGPNNGWPVILSHGFPYDVHAFDEVASIVARAGARVIAPYTRTVPDAVERVVARLAIR
jgi:pimeloyl-ACP methyl ester carboxylesterase